MYERKEVNRVDEWAQAAVPGTGASVLLYENADTGQNRRGVWDGLLTMSIRTLGSEMEIRRTRKK